MPAVNSKVVRGTFSSNARGFGFVVVEEEGKKTGVPDVFIPADKVNGALHFDTVECVLKGNSGRGHRAGRPEGTITRLISRGIPLIAGTYYTDPSYKNKSGYLVPLESKMPYYFPITSRTVKKLGLADGHLVMFKVSIEGQVQVKEVFGHKNDPGMDVLSLVRQYSVPCEFSEEVLKEAANLPYSVTEVDIENRADYRQWPIFTIDGSDTKDIDDAISLRVLPGGNYELGVHIADVSHYVLPGSLLDIEARSRGTSIYLADRVIPMLPHRLSNGICSLNPNEDRLTMSCIMEIDEAGDLVRYRIEESVIRSHRKYTYDEVLSILTRLSPDESPITNETEKEAENESKNETDNETKIFKNMNTLAEILKKKRITRGALEFNLSEAKVIVDDSGFPTDIVARKPNVATFLIEEFMILCNETVAEHNKNKPFVYRVHERPGLDKMYQLSAYAQSLGFNLPVSERGVSAKDLQTLLLSIQGTTEEAALEPIILRSLKQAKYTSENIGHFGLGSQSYCHFTSPIRRYPDLLVHRSLKAGLKKRKLSELCDHCSLAERNAEVLEREVLQLKKCQFMADKVGQTFSGIVSGVVNWGIYVQLPNTIEGLVPLDYLRDDEYVYVEKQMALFGVRKKKRIRLGDPFTVILAQVDNEERKITFAPAT